jgi:hypothetical protein
MRTNEETPSALRMTAAQAKTVEYAIVGFSVLSLILVFQPFSLTLFTTGAALVVLMGLAFNLVPLCQPGRSFSSLAKAVVIIAVIFVVVTLAALGSAVLYSIYLSAG